MLQRAYTTRSNDRNGHGIAHCTGELQIKTALGAILIHAGQQDLASPQLSDTLSPLNDIQSGTVFAALGTYLPVARGVIIAFGIDGNDEPFGAQGLGSLADELRAMNSCAVDGDLGRASLNHGLQVGQAAHPTAHNEWYIRIHGKLRQYAMYYGVIFRRTGNIEQDDFICSLLAIPLSDLDGIAGV